MDLLKVYENLCLYDERNPDYVISNGYKQKKCYCDNCFYGRNELALEIIRLNILLESDLYFD